MARDSLGARENLSSSVRKTGGHEPDRRCAGWQDSRKDYSPPRRDFDALKGREGYRQRANGDLERVEGSLVYVIVRQQSPSLTIGA
jgi:hypothetical protein